jgi:hypothetical protein
VTAFFRFTYRARAGPFSRPGRDRLHDLGDAPGICLRPSQFCSGSRVDARHFLRGPNPPAVSPLTRRAIFVARGPTVLCGRTTGFGRGSWVFAPQTSRTVPLADPAIAFARRVARIHRPRLPWAWSPLSGVRHRSAASTSEGASAPELPAPSSLRGCMPRRDDHACSSTLDGTDD